MRIKIFTRVLLVVVLSVFFCTIVGAVATWRFSELPAVGNGNDFNVTLNVFDFKPSEILPGDQEDTQLHSNHYNLIESIVNHIDYGLNATKKPIVRELLEDGAGVVYGNQNVQGGNLKHMLLSGSDVNALMFAVEYHTDTEYWSYTFSQASINLATNGDYVEVYKTIVEKKNGKWEATKSYYGKAKVFDTGVDGIISIDVKSWEYAQIANSQVEE